jgi:shikimate kinase
MGIAIAGFMGVGKSTVGGLLAERLGWSFVDLDADLVAEFGSIDAQFESVGESGFRERERAALRLRCDGVVRVLALGGGTWIDAENRGLLRAHYRCVALLAPWDTVRARVEGSASRPLAHRAEELFRTREAIYAQAECCVDARDSVERVVERILRVQEAAWA